MHRRTHRITRGPGDGGAARVRALTRFVAPVAAVGAVLAVVAVAAPSAGATAGGMHGAGVGRTHGVVSGGLLGPAARHRTADRAALSAPRSAPAHDKVVGDVPDDHTPNVLDGQVLAIAKVGGEVVLGGSFTKVSPAGSDEELVRHGLLAYDPTTGVVDPDFVPDVSGGDVNALEPTADGAGVYVGGSFSSVGASTAADLARLDLDTGAPTSGFTPPVLDGEVHDLQLTAVGRLLVAGAFTHVGSTARTGLVSVSAQTGAASSYATLTFAGHHNWTGEDGQAKGAVGVRALGMSPDEKTLIVLGNFTTVNGKARDQIARVTLGSTVATLDAGWATSVYTATCNPKLFDSYVRDVAWAPDGSYFVVGATGGWQSGSSCDAVTRFDATATGPSVTPAWVASTGADSVYSVATTGVAVYAGGHFRWMNNPLGHDVAGAGAVPRPSLAALDPANGLPYSWNPGRHPRGIGVTALVATPDGLLAGGDTKYIGNRHYRRERIASFPLATGTAIPSARTAHLPGSAFLTPAVGGTSVLYRGVTTGPVVGGDQQLPVDATWQGWHGATISGGTLFDVAADGTFQRRTATGSTFGPPTTVDPYDDPAWSDVETGSEPEGQTYKGLPPAVYENMKDLSGMFYVNKVLYYTKVGSKTLYARPFQPESGVLYATQKAVATGYSWTNTRGMFYADGYLYFGSTDGKLRRVAWSSTQLAHGSVTVVGKSTGWTHPGTFFTGT